ncbi:uncharacterized protein Z518_06136 [Rhinocladiella mackenziei CBS 650.93]|uniref:Biotrophy-associated secreted protein 2 n=1 Tax=Rhinocladiella mackenziei CBS 650.93 TaxID=1442369 RepID=A0A0D2IHJ9_9EURO|nr:uncharacterized protein Z518_06136 [Rhinocladiella mackenziei CBS 650.93]KIX05264.1 hypothetical protein Z518_06136 [Rhinocladiella mackenziei CBS 650.93]
MANTPLSRSFAFLFLLLNLVPLVFGQGTQFITGPCTSDADCASGCCGFNSGKCAGPVVAQERDGGCGFGDAQPNDNAAQALTGGGTPATSTATAAAPNMNTGAADATTTAASGGSTGNGGTGTQFITGPCTSDADCASGCCGFNSGKCAGPVVAQERDGGCGFGDAQPNDNAAQALTGGGGQPTSPAATAAQANTTAAATAASGGASGSSSDGTINSSLPGAENVGNGAGKQFITGQCFSDADCASGCCGFNSGLCAGAIIAQTRDGGCGFGDAQPNDNAAQALSGGAKRRWVREYMA